MGNQIKRFFGNKMFGDDQCAFSLPPLIFMNITISSWFIQQKTNKLSVIILIGFINYILLIIYLRGRSVSTNIRQHTGNVTDLKIRCVNHISPVWESILNIVKPWLHSLAGGVQSSFHYQIVVKTRHEWEISRYWWN